MPAFVQMSKPKKPQSLPRVIDEIAMYARANSSDDFVRDCAGSCGPILNTWFASFWIPEQHNLITKVHIQISDIKHELIHTNSASYLADFAANQNGANVRRTTWNTVGITSRN
jgi:hypothetical protein